MLERISSQGSEHVKGKGPKGFQVFGGGTGVKRNHAAVAFHVVISELRAGAHSSASGGAGWAAGWSSSSWACQAGLAGLPGIGCHHCSLQSQFPLIWRLPTHSVTRTLELQAAACRCAVHAAVGAGGHGARDGGQCWADGAELVGHVFQSGEPGRLGMQTDAGKEPNYTPGTCLSCPIAQTRPAAGSTPTCGPLCAPQMVTLQAGSHGYKPKDCKFKVQQRGKTIAKTALVDLSKYCSEVGLAKEQSVAVPLQ